MASRYAILIDGGFLRVKLRSRNHHFPTIDEVVAEFGRIRTHPSLSELSLLRIYYYDAPPATGHLTNPLDGSELDLGAGPMHGQNLGLQQRLEMLPDVALRLGEMSLDGWALGQAALKDIEKAIVAAAHLGATPNNDGTIIRVTMPELTEDRRKEYVKLVRSKGEEAKVVLRNLRRKAKDDLDATKEVGEDEIARAEKELDAVTKSHVDEIDDALKRKEAELLEV